MSIPSWTELIKEGAVIGKVPANLSIGYKHSVEAAVSHLKRVHDSVQGMSDQDCARWSIPKDYDGLRVRWNDDIVTHYLSGEALLNGEVIKENGPTSL